MKLRTLTLVIILLSVFSITVSAADYKFKLSPGDDFICAREGEKLDALAEKLGMTKEELEKYYSDNKLVYFAVSNDKKSQIKISESDDSFSLKADDISLLSDDSLKKFADAIDKNHTIVTNNDRKFVCSKSSHRDDGGEYTVTQYVTICNGKTIYFIGYNEGRQTSAQIDSAFKSFTISEKNNVWWTVARIGGIVVFSSVAIAMVIGITKNLRTKEDE